MLLLLLASPPLTKTKEYKFTERFKQNSWKVVWRLERARCQSLKDSKLLAILQQLVRQHNNSRYQASTFMITISKVKTKQLLRTKTKSLMTLSSTIIKQCHLKAMAKTTRNKEVLSTTRMSSKWDLWMDNQKQEEATSTISLSTIPKLKSISSLTLWDSNSKALSKSKTISWQGWPIWNNHLNSLTLWIWWEGFHSINH